MVSLERHVRQLVGQTPHDDERRGETARGFAKLHSAYGLTWSIACTPSKECAEALVTIVYRLMDQRVHREQF